MSSFDIPSRYICPITQQLMQDPVMDLNGHNFERIAIEKWLSSSHSNECPLRCKNVTVSSLYPNTALKEQIQEFTLVGAVKGSGDNVLDTIRESLKEEHIQSLCTVLQSIDDIDLVRKLCNEAPNAEKCLQAIGNLDTATKRMVINAIGRYCPERLRLALEIVQLLKKNSETVGLQLVDFIYSSLVQLDLDPNIIKMLSDFVFAVHDKFKDPMHTFMILSQVYNFLGCSPTEQEIKSAKQVLETAIGMTCDPNDFNEVSMITFLLYKLSDTFKDCKSATVLSDAISTVQNISQKEGMNCS